MKKLTPTICLTLAVLLGSLVTGCGSDTDSGANYDKGVAADKSDDYATALREFRPLAEQGNADAQYRMGLIYYYGEGVPQDNKTALKWLTLAAEQGYAEAQYRLGGIFWDVNNKTALKWFTLAAEQGHVSSQSNLGSMYYLGDGVPEDNVYAYMWGHIAAFNGNEAWGRTRDKRFKEMTATQIAKAKKLASECIAKKYKGC